MMLHMEIDSQEIHSEEINSEEINSEEMELEEPEMPIGEKSNPAGFRGEPATVRDLSCEARGENLRVIQGDGWGRMEIDSVEMGPEVDLWHWKPDLPMTPPKRSNMNGDGNRDIVCMDGYSRTVVWFFLCSPVLLDSLLRILLLVIYLQLFPGIYHLFESNA